MKKILMVYLLLQSLYLFADEEVMFVTAQSGLVIREKPTTNSTKIDIIPYNTKIKIIDKSKIEETIGNKTGYWYKIQYLKSKGWVFGAFLSSSKISNADSNSYQTAIKNKALEFINNLRDGKKLSSYFAGNWIFLYHEDNRCDGSTDGQSINLKPSAIDSDIVLKVENDGDGWACDKKKSRSYELNFNLTKKVKNWDRFVISNYGGDNKNSVYILGAGESDYIILYFNTEYLITKLEYRSEDPG